MNLSYLDSFAIALLAYLVIVVPLLGVWENRRLVSWVAAGRLNARLIAYRWTIVWQWATVFVLLGWWLRDGRMAAPLFMTIEISGWQWLSAVAAGAASVLLLIQTRRALSDREELVKVREKIGDLETLVPRGPYEMNVFSVLAVTAGICEEIVYRGVLMAVAISVVGPWPAMVATSVIFGLAHVYQGVGGVLKTTVVGLVMAFLTLMSGSLLPAIVLHAVIDLTSGRMMNAAIEIRE